MPQRFNAPPGWNVPPDFVPSADWQPDPSWPPAPEGWTYWVDDATPAAPAYGVAPQAGDPQAVPAYGETPPVYGSAPQAPPAYGAVPTTGMPPGVYGSDAYGAAPAGAYGSTEAGSAQLAIAQAQQSSARRNTLIGVGLMVLDVVLIFLTDRVFWYLGIIGIVLVIKGLIDMGKAKKSIAAAQGPFGGYSPQALTPPGQTPPGTF